MKKYSFFPNNQRKDVLYCSTEGKKDKTFFSYHKELEKKCINLIPFFSLDDAKKYASDNTSDIIGFILHFNWGDTFCREFIDHVKKNNLLTQFTFFFMLHDSKSSEERRKAFSWGAKETLDPDESKNIKILKDYFISYHGDFKTTIFSNVKIGLLDDSETLMVSFKDFLLQKGINKSWSFFKNKEEWEKNKNVEEGKKNFDLVIIDYRFGKDLGIQLIKEIKDSNPAAKIFIISNYISPEIEKVCFEHNADYVFNKPRDFNLILSKVFEAYTGSELKES